MTEEENAEEEKDYEEIEKRDKLIYDCIIYRYNLEWNRSKNLDGKASGIISFVGIILALQGGIGAILIKDSPKTGTSFIIMNEIFILSILCLTLAIICGLKAYYLQKWIYIPEVHSFIKKCGAENRCLVDILRITGRSIANAIDINKNNNNKKKRFIEYGFAFLAAGLILNLFFIIGVTLIMSY